METRNECSMEEYKEPKVLKILDLLKKPFDLIDDFWNTLRGVVSEHIVGILGLFLIGSLLLVIHLIDGFHAIHSTYHDIKDETIRQRRTHILTGSLKFLFAGVGAGLSATVLGAALMEVGLFGALPILGLAFFPVVIPALISG